MILRLLSSKVLQSLLGMFSWALWGRKRGPLVHTQMRASKGHSCPFPALADTIRRDPGRWGRGCGLCPPCAVEEEALFSGSGLPCPPPGALPDQGIKPVSLVSPRLAGRFFTIAPPGEPLSSKGQVQTVANQGSWTGGLN